MLLNSESCETRRACDPGKSDRGVPLLLVLRDDFQCGPAKLRAKQSDDAGQVRRLLLAALYDDASRAEAAEIADATRQIVGDWVERLNTSGLPHWSPARSWMSCQCVALTQAVEEGPRNHPLKIDMMRSGQCRSVIFSNRPVIQPPPPVSSRNSASELT